MLLDIFLYYYSSIQKPVVSWGLIATWTQEEKKKIERKKENLSELLDSDILQISFLLLNCDFVTCISHWKNIGSLGHVDLSYVDIFHHTL